MANEKGMAHFEQYMQDLTARGNVAYHTEFNIEYGAKLLHMIMTAEVDFCASFLQLSKAEQAGILCRTRKAMLSGLKHDYTANQWICPECDETEDVFFKKCSCGEKYYFSEKKLIKSINDISYYFDLDYSEIKKVTIENLAEMVEAHNSTNDTSYKIAAEGEKCEVVVEPVTEIETIMIGSFEIPLLPVVETEICRGKPSDLKSEGFQVIQPATETVTEAVGLAKAVCEQIVEFKATSSFDEGLWRKKMLEQRQRVHDKHVYETRIRMKAEQEKDKEIFRNLEKKLNLTERRKNCVLKKRKRCITWVQKKAATAQPLIAEKIITKIAHDYQERQTSEDEVTGVKCATSRSTKRHIKFKPVIGNHMQDYLMKQIGKIAMRGSLNVEIVANKERKLFVRNKRLHVYLHHHRGIRKKRDLISTKPLEVFFERFVKHAVRNYWTKIERLTHGDSGLIFRTRHGDDVGRHPGNYCIVRGRYHSRVIDARSKITRTMMHKITHYTDIPEKFWSGYNKAFLRHRKASDHNCSSDLDVQTCGEVAALITLILFPCSRITCRKCMTRVKDRTIGEVGEELHEELNRLRMVLTSYNGSFGHVSTLMDQISRVLNAKNSNTEAFQEIAAKVDGKNEAPWTHISHVNEVLLKGSLATGENFSDASNSLREIARWHMKRTESIKAGSVESFRNKRSGKAHFNPALLCDNQLDGNGNFLWGERQYHAKRFFANYFEKVDHAKGYDFYSLRKNPNGVRKIAIGNLVFSTNLERFRQQMVGEYESQGPITRECISLRHGNYVHVCSCVTLDDGKPYESELKMPTKNHIVLGNTGDPKYVDMPVLETDSMYIAKQGYCYMNIFLAMLINIPESEAKEFTKRVRDLVGAKLGEWPTMLDVATCANQLVVFHPDAADAELPRILVDHKNKCMHVLDSFGSITTGYHVLKANTVNQLINFARLPLDSELQHYVVGGQPSIANKRDIIALIECAYKPQKLIPLLEEEPYIIIMALESPSVLLTLFNSGALEYMINHWMKRDQDVATMISTVSGLARKISRAEFIQDQIREIRNNARDIQLILDRQSKPWLSYTRAHDYLTVCDSMRDTDTSLDLQGYRSKEFFLCADVERIYARMLAEQWSALTLSEKLRARCFSWASLKPTTEYLIPGGNSGLSVIYNFSPRYCVLEAREVLLKPIRGAMQVVTNLKNKAVALVRKTTVRTINLVFGDMLRLVNVIIVISFLVQIMRDVQKIIIEQQLYKQQQEERNREKDFEQLEALYYKLSGKLGGQPTIEEYLEFVGSKRPDLVEKAHLLTNTLVEHQAKTAEERRLEQIIAFFTLLMMMVDAERSDCLYRILNKFKGVVGTIEQDVYHQSIDDISDIFDDKQETIDFEINTEYHGEHGLVDLTFEKWWDSQLSRNNVVGHYRIGGEFVEFSRSNAALVANIIAHGEHKEYMVRGAVGSGKSTNLPHLLSSKGSILLIEPTRPLCENVGKQLRGAPFHKNPTVRMRGLTTFGSAPITIMTSGFALHYFAHNVEQLKEFDFIMFDECHVVDASAMGFYCLLQEHNTPAKILKVSATPPGHEVEFTTQFPVKLLTEDSISFQQLVASFGTKSVSDVTQYADNILVYVASYNEVDQLSKLLLEKKYQVTKIDGRTMKVGKTEIETFGTPDKKHFIVATNIIENGVTLNIDAVIDFGMKVVPELDTDNRLIRYSKRPISYGERIQRLGRVGRHKAGVALRIGHTEKGIQEIPELVATEAALLSFTYGLPVMTHNVGIGLLSRCTVRQAKTMMFFEVNPLFTVNLVSSEGAMHPKIHELLKRYKLRDSEIQLSATAIPHGVESIWISAREYNNMGCNLDVKEGTRIPFVCKDLPEKLYEEIWEAVQLYKRDITFGRITSAAAGKIAYTLQTDIYSIPRTIATIDTLIESENAKHAHFKAMTSRSTTSSSFSLLSIINSIQSRYMVDHSQENIRKLQQARSQLQQFQAVSNSKDINALIKSFECMRTVYHQSVDGRKHVIKELALKGMWNKSLLCKDALICGFTLAGGLTMLWHYFQDRRKSLAVYHQGFSARQRQKLRFRDARLLKVGREVLGEDAVIADHFGDAYIKKGKKKGRTHGMGAKTRKFVSSYGFRPEDYSYVRFLDPVTGEVLEEAIETDLDLVQEHFSTLRQEWLDGDKIDRQQIMSQPGIKAYYIKSGTKSALEVDLTPHNPLLLCEKSVTIAGFPEREYSLRQTGPAKSVPYSQVPKPIETVQHEGKSLCSSMRNYSGITTSICHIKNTSGNGCSLYGLGYNSYIITNRHLFKENNGTLVVQSHHGNFTVRNTTTLKMVPVEKTDIVIIQMPKDFPPFHSKLRFRKATETDKVVMVGLDFQDNHIASKISETSHITVKYGGFGRHWISTKDGDCGLPLVSPLDGCIVGIHSLSSAQNLANYFAVFPQNFESDYLQKLEALNWSKHWKYNCDEICWGSLRISNSKPEAEFKAVKSINELAVYPQSGTQKWLFEKLHGNLKGVAETTGNLVTKHVVRGPCVLFEQYLNTHEEAEKFFRPLMGHYMKSVLNKEAYAKDLLKYASEIVVGEVDHKVFKNSIRQVCELLCDHDGTDLEYVTDSETIITSLSMDAAVGALYSGKKRAYFEGSTVDERENLVRMSCKRLYEGKLGVWNGSLKAEIRPAEKVLAGKTRTFTAAPIDTLLGAKVCVDGFNNWFYSKHIICPWTVGMTKFYRGWDEFLRKFPDGWIYCDADGSQFDNSLSPYLINAVLSIRMWAMEEWDIGEQMLRNLYSEITYTPIACPDGTIVKKFKGNNSGQPSTVVDNTLMVLLTMYYSLQKSGYSAEEQEKVCVFYINGDDLCIAVHPEHTVILDNMQGHFRELGLNYDFSSRHTRREDLWFMSHKGVLVDGIYIPKLEQERIVAILEWDKAKLPEHRLEAIAAAIIESWGYPELTMHIRAFYHWVLEQAPYNDLARDGKAPYISEAGLRNLYMSERGSQEELFKYLDKFFKDETTEHPELLVYHQADIKDKVADAGANTSKPDKKENNKGKEKDKESEDKGKGESDRDVDLGSSGSFTVPRMKTFNDKMMLPRVKGKTVLNLAHLLEYNPQQLDLANTRSTTSQFEKWYEGVKSDYGLTDDEMPIVLNGLMVWCIENGTSPDISGVWVMMDGDQQVEYPIKPLLEHATPTFRQIMAHFSNAAEAYIAKRNATERYMPRYGQKRNLTDLSLARYAFDFYEMTSKTPQRAREAHLQMKAAALRNANRRLFGIDGSVSSGEENTERHTVEDVDRDMHTLLGMRK